MAAMRLYFGHHLANQNCKSEQTKEKDTCIIWINVTANHHDNHGGKLMASTLLGMSGATSQAFTWYLDLHLPVPGTGSRSPHNVHLKWVEVLPGMLYA